MTKARLMSLVIAAAFVAYALAMLVPVGMGDGGGLFFR